MKISENLERLKDPKFYLENFTKIKGKKPGALIPFILNEAQKDLFNAVKRNDRIIINKSRQIGFCLSPDTKILTANLKWIKIEDIKIGSKVISVDENISGGKGSERRIKTSIVEKKWSVYDNAIKVIFDNGEQLILTGKHRMLYKSGKGLLWKSAEDFKIGDKIRFITKPWGESTYEDYWFGGILDGEGTMQNKKRRVNISVFQTEGVVLDRIENYIKNKGYICCKSIDDRFLKKNVSGKKRMISFTFCRMQDLFKVIGQCKVTRFLQYEWWNGRRLPQNGWAKIVSIEGLPKRKMIDLQTSRKTFIANGFVSHNSTAMVGWMYHNTITVPGTTTAIIGYNSDLTSELLDKVKTFYRTTPASLKPTIQYNSKYEISFPRLDSKILVLPSTVNVGRGYTISNCLATELSSWENAEEKMMTLEASVPITGKLVIESTPKGAQGLYHRMWMAEDNGYIKKEYGWHWGYSRKEIEIIRKRMNNPSKFAQEYLCSFLASGRAVFDPYMIKEQRKNIWKLGETYKQNGEIYKVKEVDHLRTYKEPVAGGMYAAGIDVSEGVEGGDYSFVTIWDRTTGEEVAMFRGLIPPDRLADKLYDWGIKYNKALMVVEINNHGLTTLTCLKQKVYPSLYFRPKKIDSLGVSSSDKFGWRTTKVTRPLLIDEFAQACRDKEVVIHSKELLDEMSVFIYDDNGNMVPGSGFHDDGIFSAGIAWQGFKLMPKTKLRQLDYQQHLPTNFAY